MSKNSDRSRNFSSDVFAYRLAYDGRNYHGFQRQPSVPTVEGAIFAALKHVEVPFDGETPRGYTAAGRTDAGVSARAQTIGFAAPSWLTAAVLSNALPGDVHAWARSDVTEDFHARYHAVARTYTYHLLRQDLDEAAVRSAIAALDGYHDFHNLTPDKRSTRRRIDCAVRKEDGFLVIEITARGFPRQFVRRFVSLVATIGRGECPLHEIGRALEHRPLPGHRGIEPAAPEPLVLANVQYPGIRFAVDGDALATAETAFEARHRDALTAGAVFRSISTSFR